MLQNETDGQFDQRQACFLGKRFQLKHQFQLSLVGRYGQMPPARYALDADAGGHRRALAVAPAQPAAGIAAPIDVCAHLVVNLGGQHDVVAPVPVSALATISSDSPSEYTSAVSTKLTPASGAATNLLSLTGLDDGNRRGFASALSGGTSPGKPALVRRANNGPHWTHGTHGEKDRTEVAVVKRSAGIVLFRQTDAGIEVLLGHSGGPFFTAKDVGAWSIPKGEYDTDELPFDAASREFTEELGLPVPAGRPLPLGEVVQKNRKVVTAWAIEADLDPVTIRPGTFTMEWPRGSGDEQQFPEIDRVAWFALSDAAPLMIAGQQALLDRLTTAISNQ